MLHACDMQALATTPEDVTSPASDKKVNTE
jgi:hypothetical protein